jgi:hypothetical protein
MGSGEWGVDGWTSSLASMDRGPEPLQEDYSENSERAERSEATERTDSAERTENSEKTDFQAGCCAGC